jgi:hypothetical protein
MDSFISRGRLKVFSFKTRYMYRDIVLRWCRLERLTHSTDPVAQHQRITNMNNNTHTARKTDALDRVVKLIEVLIQSPHLAFGIIVWAYVAWFMLAL